MNKKNPNRIRSLAVMLPFLVAAGLLSMSEYKNQHVRNFFSEKLLFVSRFISSNKEKNYSPFVENWFQRQKLSLHTAEWQAGQFAPFSITSQNSSCDYIVATVLYRNINSWNSSIWINKGYEDSALIARNSPVLSKDSLIGVIDYVGKHASCVRLITDSSVTPAVRVLRDAADPQLCFAFATLIKAIEENSISFHSEEEMKGVIKLLQKVKEEKSLNKEPKFLAKGLLQGHGEPLWKAQNAYLKGYGFNYDFKDQYGGPRELRSKEPLIRTGDLLITSGLDGIFPEGLKVAKVHTIFPLQEGAFAYDILAESTADDLLDLKFVTILPPQDFDPEKLPQPLDRIQNLLQ